MPRIRFLAILSAILLLFSSCAAMPLSRTAMHMDTTCSVTIYGGDAAALDACFTTVEVYEWLWSRTDESGELSALNAARGAPRSMTADTVALLQLAKEYAVLTNGAFDVTTAPLTDLWKAAEEADVLPDAAALASACARVGADKLHINGDTVALKGGAQLDLGAIAKGAVADKAADTLRARGCDGALLDFGGNIVAMGTKPNGQWFHIGIADPRDSGELIATVAVADKAVVTSGSYERGYTVGGKRYSHILDPKSGRPVENDLLSVTIIADQAADADALSTACFVMGYDNARALIDSLDGFEAVFVTADGAVEATDGVSLV